jgi:hypothetical protein
MPAPLRVTLNEESDRTLQELRVAIKVSQHIKDRAHMVRLNAQGWQYILVKGERLKVLGEENGSFTPFPLPLYPLTEKY